MPPLKALRPYERALLDALSDGAEHERTDLVRIVAEAVPDHEGLSLYQRRYPEKTNNFAGLSVQDQLEEAQRQTMSGKRAQADKTLSHMADRGYTMVTDTTERGGRMVRSTFKITQRGLDALAGRFDGNRDHFQVLTPQWQRRILALLEDDPEMQPTAIIDTLIREGYAGSRTPVGKFVTHNRKVPARGGRKPSTPQVFTSPWQNRVRVMLREDPSIQAAEIHRRLQKEGYPGSDTAILQFVRNNRIAPARTNRGRRAGGGPVLTAEWRSRLDEMLADDPQLRPSDAFRIIQTEGYAGSLPPVSTYLQRARTMPPLRGTKSNSLLFLSDLIVVIDSDGGTAGDKLHRVRGLIMDHIERADSEEERRSRKRRQRLLPHERIDKQSNL